MTQSMKYDESYIKNFLTKDGHSISDYFIVDDLIMNLSELNGEIIPIAFVIEDDSLALDCIEYLKEVGGKQFNSMDELNIWINKL